MSKYSSLKDWPGPGIAMPNKWATFILDRNKQFKEHENRGHALNAIKDTHAGILYRLNEQTQTWDEVLRIEGNYQLAPCDNCGVTHGEDEDHGGMEVYIQRYWIDMKQEVPTLAHFCYSCYRVAKEFKMK